MEKHNYKITDKQFLETFYEQSGNYANTAKALQRKYGVNYTRQGVYERAKCFPEETRQLWELREDYSEGALLTFADDEANDIRLRVRIHLSIMNRLSRYNLRRIAMETTQSAQPMEEEPVDFSDKLMQLAEQNKTLQNYQLIDY